MLKTVLRTACLACALLSSLPAAAQQPEHAVIDKLWHGDYEVDKDGRGTQTVEHRLQVLKDNALEDMKVYSFSFSTSIQTGDVLEAYTLKKDGRKLTVPEGNYQRHVSDGRGRAGPIFSDNTRISVVFPDLAVGDSIHIRYRIREKEPMFPGHFSMAMGFSPFRPYEDVRLTVRAPKELPLLTEAYQLQAVAPKEAGGQRVLEWRYANTQPRRYNDEEDGGLWERGEYPNVLLSTFASYEAIATAYGERALPKAQPTTRIRELAAQIVGKETQPREQARLLYEWVSRNLTYGGNCIGVGAVVPRDLDVVLDNKMGDCKDHATLLQALLSATGIRSEQVLINAGNEYDLPKTPVVSLVNHVMNYLPEFKLYVDATAKEIPFGYLPRGSYGKPVIHVGVPKALATVPPADHLGNEQRLQMTLKLADNGSASGTMRVAVKGLEAAGMRAYMRELSPEAEREFVKQSLAGSGYRGRGKLDKGDTQGVLDHYEYSVEFQIDNFLRGGASGALVLGPVLGSPMSVLNFAGYDDPPPAKRRQVCNGFHSYETYDIELPANFTLLSAPDDAQQKGSYLDYTARYEKTATGMKVTRELHDKTASSVCPPEITNEFNKQATRVGENLRTQVLYKRKAQ